MMKPTDVGMKAVQDGQFIILKLRILALSMRFASLIAEFDFDVSHEENNLKAQHNLSDNEEEQVTSDEGVEQKHSAEEHYRSSYGGID
jgi:hypothetical protein